MGSPRPVSPSEAPSEGDELKEAEDVWTIVLLSVESREDRQRRALLAAESQERLPLAPWRPCSHSPQPWQLEGLEARHRDDLHGAEAGGRRLLQGALWGGLVDMLGRVLRHAEAEHAVALDAGPDWQPPRPHSAPALAGMRLPVQPHPPELQQRWAPSRPQSSLSVCSAPVASSLSLHETTAGDYLPAELYHGGWHPLGHGSHRNAANRAPSPLPPLPRAHLSRRGHCIRRWARAGEQCTYISPVRPPPPGRPRPEGDALPATVEQLFPNAGDSDSELSMPSPQQPSPQQPPAESASPVPPVPPWTPSVPDQLAGVDGVWSHCTNVASGSPFSSPNLPPGGQPLRHTSSDAPITHLITPNPTPAAEQSVTLPTEGAVASIGSSADQPLPAAEQLPPRVEAHCPRPPSEPRPGERPPPRPPEAAPAKGCQWQVDAPGEQRRAPAAERQLQVDPPDGGYDWSLEEEEQLAFLRIMVLDRRSVATAEQAGRLELVKLAGRRSV